MKLYSYDHCPYCVKARMIFGLKKIDFEHIILLNDDEETPISMVGKKLVPILEKDNGEYMPESMDIVRWCDNEFGSPIVSESKNDKALNNWLEESRTYNYALAMPRWVAMGLEEFSTESAIQYFEQKKYSSIGPFDCNLAITKNLIEMAEKHLSQLDKLMSSGPWFWGVSLNEDDFHVFAALRVLTTVKGLRFSDKIDAYTRRLSDASGVPLHWDKALGGPSV